jgi:hypothetical protein
MNKAVVEKLASLHACSEAIEWVEAFKGTPVQAWKACERGDWMLWLCGKYAGEPWSDARKPLVLAACECARLALKYVPEDEKRPLVAIETAEKWTKGEATKEEMKTANAAAAYAASYAAEAAAYTASYAHAKKKILNQCAGIVRKYYPEPPKEVG